MQIISANRLSDGIVVYAGHGGAWVERLDQARIFASKAEADAGLSLAQNDAARNLIVEPFLVGVTQDAGGLRPSTLRDSIRAHGPTIDFRPRRGAAAPSAIPPPNYSGAIASKPLAPGAHPADLRTSAASAWEPDPAAGLAEELAQ